MDNTLNGANFDFYTALAAFYAFCLLFRPRLGVAFPSPERILPFEQGALFFDRGPFSFGINSPKPDLPRDPRTDFRVAPFGRSSIPNLAEPSQVCRLDTDILFQRRSSDAGADHNADNNFPRYRSNPAGS